MFKKLRFHIPSAQLKKSSDIKIVKSAEETLVLRQTDDKITV